MSTRTGYPWRSSTPRHQGNVYWAGSLTLHTRWNLYRVWERNKDNPDFSPGGFRLCRISVKWVSCWEREPSGCLLLLSSAVWNWYPCLFVSCSDADIQGTQVVPPWAGNSWTVVEFSFLCLIFRRSLHVVCIFCYKFLIQVLFSPCLTLVRECVLRDANVAFFKGRGRDEGENIMLIWRTFYKKA